MHKFLASSLFIGKPIVNVPYCHSTNDIAADLGQKGEILEGGVVVTPKQTAGRGQRGNKWESEPGTNLTFSIYLKPGFVPVVQQFQLHYMTSLGIIDFLDSHLRDKAFIKWPNDIYVNDKKLGGILIENSIKANRLETSVIGIGLNVNQLVFVEPSALSMSNLTGVSFDLERILEELLLKIEWRYLELKRGKVKELKKEYLSRLLWKDSLHLFREPEGEIFEGMITGIDESGRLEISKDRGVNKYNFKEIEFIG